MGLEADGRSDLYSVGLIAHELLTGRPAFSERDPVELLQRHILDDVPSLPHVSGDLEALVLWLCKRLRRDRLASATEALACLRSLQVSGMPERSAFEQDSLADPAAMAFTLGAMRVVGAVGAVVVSASDGMVVAAAGDPRVREQARMDIVVVQAQLDVLGKLGRASEEVREFTITLGDVVQLIYISSGGRHIGFVFVDRRVGNLALARKGLAPLLERGLHRREDDVPAHDPGARLGRSAEARSAETAPRETDTGS